MKSPVIITDLSVFYRVERTVEATAGMLNWAEGRPDKMFSPNPIGFAPTISNIILKIPIYIHQS